MSRPRTRPSAPPSGRRTCPRTAASTARYSYTQTARYADPLGFASDPDQPSFDTGEEAPHIVFTPYLRALAAQLTRGVTSPAEKAQRFYDFVTLNVHYHYQPSYFVLEDIPTRCAMDRRGDCGIMALTFITLCRIAGIPARWQSGLAVGPASAAATTGPCSTSPPRLDVRRLLLWGVHGQGRGGGRRRHYFGSIDPGGWWPTAHSRRPSTRPCWASAPTPYDNQTGEVEADGVGLWGDQTVTTKETLAYEEL